MEEITACLHVHRNELIQWEQLRYRRNVAAVMEHVSEEEAKCPVRAQAQLATETAPTLD